MRPTRYGLIALTAMLIGASPDDPEKKKDADAFKGTWNATSQSANGQTVSEEALKGVRVKFDGKFYTLYQGDMVVEEGSYTVDPAKDPKTLDFMIEKGTDAGKKQLGIYELDGDTLKFCVSLAGEPDRPKALEAKSGTNMLFVFKRHKE